MVTTKGDTTTISTKTGLQVDEMEFFNLLIYLLRSQSVGDRWGREDRGGFKANNFRKDAR